MEGIQPLAELLGLDEGQVDALIIRELLDETWKTARSRKAVKPYTEVWLGCTGTLNALAGEYDDPIHYHHLGCRRLTPSGDERFSVPVSMAERVGFLPCDACIDLSIEIWASDHHLNPDLARKVIDRTRTALAKGEALQILRAVGEPPHPSLLSRKADAA